MESVADEKELKRWARKIGFPLLLKASAGGGGKGLRLVSGERDLLSAFQLARSEALSSFADPAVYIEKYIEEPHHIEIQILADGHGNVIHLGERECSIQRRHQKLVEESPSPFVADDEDFRQKLGALAVRAAQSVRYVNAGTIEFLVDKDKNYYFLEMNTLPGLTDISDLPAEAQAAGGEWRRWFLDSQRYCLRETRSTFRGETMKSFIM
jgi:acetyl-CoA carboxylase biotin carboxylase subunit